jgi:hypothetical protein
MIHTKDPEKYERLLKQARSALSVKEYKEAARYYDAIQMEDSEYWESSFYYFYCNAMQEYSSQFSAEKFKLRAETAVRKIAIQDDLSDDEKKEKTIALVVDIMAWMKDEIDANQSSAERSVELELDTKDEANSMDSVCGVGYAVGDALLALGAKKDTAFFNQQALKIMQYACVSNYGLCQDKANYKAHAAKVKKLDPHAKVGGEGRRLCCKIIFGFVVLLILWIVGCNLMKDKPISNELDEPLLSPPQQVVLRDVPPSVSIPSESTVAPVASDPIEAPVALTSANSATLDEKGQTEVSSDSPDIESSMREFDAYVSEMKSSNKSKNWDAKYRGKTLVLKAVFKKVKTKKGDTTIECSVNGENVVVYMKRGFTDKAQTMSSGEVFYVKGIVDKKRWGLLHTMGLSDGEILSR